MKLEDIFKKYKSTELLSAEEREKLVRLAKSMKVEDLGKIDVFFKWADKQKNILDGEKNMVTTGIKTMFAALNSSVFAKAVEKVKENEKARSENDAENIINKIENEL